VLRGDFLDALRSLPARRLLQAAGSGAAARSADATAAYFAAVEESARASAVEQVPSRRRAGRLASCTCLLPCCLPKLLSGADHLAPWGRRQRAAAGPWRS